MTENLNFWLSTKTSYYHLNHVWLVYQFFQTIKVFFHQILNFQNIVLFCFDNKTIFENLVIPKCDFCAVLVLMFRTWTSDIYTFNNKCMNSIHMIWNLYFISVFCISISFPFIKIFNWLKIFWKCVSNPDFDNENETIVSNVR